MIMNSTRKRLYALKTNITSLLNVKLNFKLLLVVCNVARLLMESEEKMKLILLSVNYR